MPIPTDKVIHAEPTKELFISMLIKDIPLTRAIIDLVDNSVDGARRLHPNRDFDGLTIRIEARPEDFKIADNCGGIDPETARKYAFRFGRAEGAKATRRSVGQFGVGMKRALFKLGSVFGVESWTRKSHFLVKIDVEEWKKEPENKWEFKFAKLQENIRVADNKVGTTITVSTLHASVQEDFKLANFITRLGNEIKEAHQLNIDRKLGITLNGIPLHIDIVNLFSSTQIKPAFEEIKYRQDPTTGEASKAKVDEVTVKIYAGIAKSNPKAAGWYLFCNGRLILGADQTQITGWGEGRNNPKFHNQYAMFRGYVFFDADNASLLPWNTTKTGVDSDSAAFKAIRQRMIVLMQPVLTFLNDLDRKKDAPDQPLHEAVEAATVVRVSDVKRSAMFVAPKKPKLQPETARIAYTKPLNQVEKAKKKLKAASNRDVGIMTFEYFYERVCRDDDD